MPWRTAHATFAHISHALLFGRIPATDTHRNGRSDGGTVAGVPHRCTVPDAKPADAVAAGLCIHVYVGICAVADGCVPIGSEDVVPFDVDVRDGCWILDDGVSVAEYVRSTQCRCAFDDRVVDFGWKNMGNKWLVFGVLFLLINRHYFRLSKYNGIENVHRLDRIPIIIRFLKFSG